MTHPRTRPLILNVDDNEIGRYTIHRELRREGYDVVDAANGSVAIEFGGFPITDLVLLDIHLPDIDGFEVCHRLKSEPRTAGIPVLHLSASFLDDVSRARGLNSGADGYLTEPVDPAVLSATIKALLRMKQAERSERLAAQQWQATFDAIADGVAILDLQGKILRTNGALGTITGKPHAELAGQEWTSLFPCEGEQNTFQKMLESGKREIGERSLNSKALRISCDPISDESGATVGGVAIVNDVTEWRKLQETLQHAHKLESIGILAGGVAHEFNNLLTGILGNANLALESAPRSIAEHLVNVVQAGERAADLARQLLAYAGKGQFLLEATDVPELVRGLAPLVRAAVPRKVKVTLELEPDAPPVCGDAAQLRQMLMNLMMNGAEAVGENAGAVRIRVRSTSLTAEEVRRQYYCAGQVEAGNYLVIEVADDGCGMDEVTQSKIFDPFFTTKFMGRGLGLASALGIVRQHGGGIRVQSTLGAGTVFEVVLPASESQTPAKARRDAVPTGPDRSGAILVVDDEEIVRNYTRTVLKRAGYQVMLASNGAEGVELFSKSHADLALVLLDLTMPVMGGEEALSRILELRPDAKVLIVSGYDETDAVRRVGDSRIAGFLQKPYDPVRLCKRVRELLREKSSAASVPAGIPGSSAPRCD